MKNKFFIGSGTAFLCILSACLLNLPIMALVLKIIDLFVELEFFARIVVSLAVSVICVSGIQGAVRYFAAYRSASFDIRMFSANFWTATVLQLAIALLLKFATFIAGGTVYLAGIFEHGAAFSSLDDIEYIGLLDYLPAFFILSLLAYGISLVCVIIGKKKRLKDRAELTTGINN